MAYLFAAGGAALIINLYQINREGAKTAKTR
jgi:hypothetical protein